MENQFHLLENLIQPGLSPRGDGHENDSENWMYFQ